MVEPTTQTHVKVKGMGLLFGWEESTIRVGGYREMDTALLVYRLGDECTVQYSTKQSHQSRSRLSSTSPG